MIVPNVPSGGGQAEGGGGGGEWRALAQIPQEPEAATATHKNCTANQEPTARKKWPAKLFPTVK